MIPNIGPLEIVIVLVIVLIIFGPKRLPGLGKSLGTGMREFKDSVTGKGGDDDEPAPNRSQLPPQTTRIDADPPPEREPAKPAAERSP